MLHTVRPLNKSFCLQVLCEENYLKLFRLIPNIRQNDFTSTAIHSDVLAIGPFTYTVYLHQIAHNTASPQTRFKCRIYLDTKSIEVISVDGDMAHGQQQTASPKGILNKKWALNYFFEKWLMFQQDLSRSEERQPQVINA